MAKVGSPPACRRVVLPLRLLLLLLLVLLLPPALARPVPCRRPARPTRSRGRLKCWGWGSRSRFTPTSSSAWRHGACPAWHASLAPPQDPRRSFVFEAAPTLSGLSAGGGVLVRSLCSVSFSLSKLVQPATLPSKGRQCPPRSAAGQMAYGLPASRLLSGAAAPAAPGRSTHPAGTAHVLQAPYWAQSS